MNLTPQLEQLHIIDTRAHLIPFRLNWAQEAYLAEMERQYRERKLVRIIVLKARQLGICLDPSTRILTADLRWVPIDSVQPGDEVVATDLDNPGTGRGQGRKMRTAVVQARRDVYEPGFRLTMENGETLIATRQHRFLSRVRGGTDTVWRGVDDTRVGDEIRYVTQPWGESDFEDGWFGGMLDGEGSLRPKTRAGVECCVAQVAGPVLNRAADYLKSRGYTMRVDVDDRKSGASSKFGNQPVFKLVLGRMNELFRLVGQTRPTRFGPRRWWEGKDLPGKHSGVGWSKVLATEAVPAQRMVDLQTSTGTFIAEGFVSHNSTLTEAVMFLWCFIHDNIQGLVIAHENDSAQHLLGMTQTYWETYPYGRAYTAKYKSRNELAWVETKSGMKVSTAKNVNTGRSRTLHMVHASEVAFWEKAPITMGGLDQAFHFEPNTIGVLESTANGVGGYFHDQWYAAEAREVEYVPLFFPWWKHPQYTWGYINQMINQPTPPLDNMNEEERVLRRMGVGDDHLLWRRWALRNLAQNDLAWFHQEYPSTPEEAFVATGYNVFPLSDLRGCYEPIERPLTGRLLREGSQVRFVPDIAGPLKIYQTPSSDYDWGRYMVAGDPTRVTTGDFAAAQVINRRTYRQVATWRGRIDGASFAEELAKLGIYYNTALLTCETTGAGYTAMGALINMNYPNLYKHRYADKEPSVIATNFGWDTNHQRKEWMIGFLLKLIVDRTLTVHDKTTFYEMQNYVSLPNGSYGPNSSSGFDDTVTSLAQACICSSTDLLEAYTGPVNKVLDSPERDNTWQAWNEEPAS